MKKTVLAFVVVAAITLAVNTANAQKTSANLFMETAIAQLTDDMVDNVAEGTSVTIDEINPVALSKFAKGFKKATGVKWMVLKDGYMAKFTTDGNVTEKIYYHLNGSYAGTLKGYTAENLPSSVAGTVNENYNDYKILYVNEAKVAGRGEAPTFIIQVQSDNDFKVIRIYQEVVDVLFDSNKPETPKRF